MRAYNEIADLPASVPVFPLAGALLFPRAVLPLSIFEPRYLEMVDHALAHDRLIGVIQPRIGQDGRAREGHRPPLASVGTVGRLTHFEEQPDDRYIVALTGLCRFRPAHELDTDTGFRQVVIEAGPFASDFEEGLGEGEVDRRAFISTLRAYADFADFDLDWDDIENMDLEYLVNACVMASPYGPRERQALLQTPTLRDRAEMLTALAEVEMSRQQHGRTLQ